jgi:hypothetical protein
MRITPSDAMSADNPLKQIYNAIWSLLEARSELTDLVLIGDRIKYIGSSRAPEKNEVLSTDFPEIRVIPVQSKPHLDQDSTSSGWIVVWQVQIASGDQRLQTVLDVEWEVYRAMQTWRTHVMPLTWKGKEFVHLARPIETVWELDNKRLNRGIRGWSAVWAGETHMNFTTADL